MAINGGSSFCPNGILYVLGYNDLYQIDLATGNFTLVNTGYLGSPFSSVDVACANDSIFYGTYDPAGHLWERNVNTLTDSYLGDTGFGPFGGFTKFNGEYYDATFGSPFNGIVKVDINQPSNSTLIVPYPPGVIIYGITASPICNTLIGVKAWTDELVTVNLLDGAITTICHVMDPNGTHYLTTFLEHVPPTICENYIDLDCNDSSGATGADYNAQDYTCLSDGVGIADDDIKLLYDARISTMTIKINGFIPDGTYEILEVTTSVAGINVSGDGTSMITLSDAGGAKSTDFKAALQYVIYKNEAPSPTAGLRTVDVKFTTETGTMSNIATAFIDVIELPLVEVDLGPDQLICEDESILLNAGNPGAVYSWSTGAHSQTITVDQSGQYMVTVSDGINCPGKDTIEVDMIPVIHVSLTGDEEICDNQEVTLTIDTDTPFPLTVEITPFPGSPFILTNVIGQYEFIDLIGSLTVYTITDIIPSQPVCIEMTDSTQEIIVYPSYITNADASICDGDSIFLGYYWENQAGYYPILYNSLNGCDSMVNYTITVLPSVHLSIQSTTCDPSGVGVFITHLNNPTGCDTVVQTTVTLLPSDTTSIALNTCNSSATGIFMDTLMNIQGCDSFIITTVSLMPPQDTTRLLQTTCDSSLLGVFQQLLINQSGCDSLVITTIDFALSDTVLVNTSSCDPAQVGVFMQSLIGQDGCDSIVFTTVTAGFPDTTYASATTCDSASLGVVETHLTNLLGCDSTVFTTVSYSAQDSVFIFNTTCDPAEVSINISQYTNQFGCDSIVTETVSLLSSDQTFINSTTCDSLQAGIFIYDLTNQNGCDSVVTETITVLPHDHSFLLSFTCDPNAVSILTTHYSNLFGCDSIVTSTVSLLPADTTIFSFKTCDPGEVSLLTSHYSNQNGCDSVVIEQTSLYPLPDLQVQVTSDFNGYDISCQGEADGSVMANVSGVSPFAYMWSTGSTDQSITGLLAGPYTVTITDANGCKADGEITLSVPGPFMISFMVSNPDCFNQHDGSITVEQTGGVMPIRYSMDGINYQSSPTFTGLSGGTYQITTLDANDCEKKEIIFINVPLLVNVELGDDQIIDAGDTVLINAIVNVPFDSLASITWSGLTNPNCPTCLTQPVVPIITTTYSVSVTSVDGCKDEDALTLFLEKKTDIYIPNIFTPNGDNINDKLIISAGSDVEEISSFIIFDRWGNMVFSRDHFQANDPNVAWDGRLKGRDLNSAVFAYRLIAKFRDGSQFIKEGDVTLLR